jgi:hypothetical protein
MSKYKSPFSVDQRKPVVMANSDPRNKTSSSLEKYRGRSGREVLVKNIPSPADLASSNALFLAVSTSGKIAITSDGVKWSLYNNSKILKISDIDPGA